jgi:hypothetical protein
MILIMARLTSILHRVTALKLLLTVRMAGMDSGRFPLSPSTSYYLQKCLMAYRSFQWHGLDSTMKMPCKPAKSVAVILLQTPAQAPKYQHSE